VVSVGLEMSSARAIRIGWHWHLVHIQMAMLASICPNSCGGKNGIAPLVVQLFEWSYNDIAVECEQYLGPNGFDSIQISPPFDHVAGDIPFPGFVLCTNTLGARGVFCGSMLMMLDVNLQRLVRGILALIGVLILLPCKRIFIFAGDSWNVRYQPVTYNITSRSGNISSLRMAVARCAAAGVKTYAGDYGVTTTSTYYRQATLHSVVAANFQ